MRTIPFSKCDSYSNHCRQRSKAMTHSRQNTIQISTFYSGSLTRELIYPSHSTPSPLPSPWLQHPELSQVNVQATITSPVHCACITLVISRSFQNTVRFNLWLGFAWLCWIRWRRGREIRTLFCGEFVHPNTTENLMIISNLSPWSFDWFSQGSAHFISEFFLEEHTFSYVCGEFCEVGWSRKSTHFLTSVVSFAKSADQGRAHIFLRLWLVLRGRLKSTHFLTSVVSFAKSADRSTSMLSLKCRDSEGEREKSDFDQFDTHAQTCADTL